MVPKKKLSYVDMALEAITSLNGHRGASLPAIKKYMWSQYHIEVKPVGISILLLRPSHDTLLLLV